MQAKPKKANPSKLSWEGSFNFPFNWIWCIFIFDFNFNWTWAWHNFSHNLFHECLNLIWVGGVEFFQDVWTSKISQFLLLVTSSLILISAVLTVHSYQKSLTNKPHEFCTIYDDSLYATHFSQAELVLFEFICLWGVGGGFVGVLTLTRLTSQNPLSDRGETGKICP